MTKKKVCKLSDLIELLVAVNEPNFKVRIYLDKCNYVTPKSVGVVREEKTVYIGISEDDH
jgi:hypothetical protein